MESSVIQPSASVSLNEDARLAKLHGYNIINNYQQQGTFQHVCGMAGHIFSMPIAVVNLVDRDTVWTMAGIGADGISTTDRAVSLCSMAILQDDVTIFGNAKEEPCLISNPAMRDNFGIQFYAGAPLKTPDGYKIGALVIADKKPREFSPDDAKMLEDLAAIVMEELEERFVRITHKS